ncbi:MAG: phospho-N-acetylmuramoyl-pentapeptide-transferase [Candidatus Latescibacterota bacterium]|nr:MAG: phospho-N-acetylmuramoyl-pentapeptide-transferase [Candidatus Latescibacterota bacterium]
MLYLLLYPLHEQYSFFNVFRYITFRSAYAAVTALLVSFLLGPWIIRKLRKSQFLEVGSELTPETHRAKQGTPTMGGILILLAIVVPTLLWADITNRYTQLALLSTIWLGAIGLLDDYMKVVKRYPRGLVGRYKLAGQVALGLVLGLVLTFLSPEPEWATKTTIPFFKHAVVDFRLLYIPFVVVVLTGASNGVNLTDGLDGLAIGLVALGGFTFAGMAYVTGNAKFAEYLNIPFLNGTGELTVFCGALVGAALGFLWWNAHPAQIFMGDTGSLALGGALGAVAVFIKMEFLLALVGGVFVIEVLSVMLQVASFRWRGKRIFLMAPLHHHFELKKWPEEKIVVRFWIAGILFALLSLSTLKLR